MRYLRVAFLLLAAILAGSRDVCAADAAPGLEHLRAGRVDEALKHFEAAMASNPDDLVTLNMIGAILCMKDEPADAVPYFERALRIDPGFVPARKNLAIAEFELGRFETAGAHLQALIDVPEARAQASLFLGMIASESGRHDEAILHFESAGELTGSQPRGLIAFSRSLAAIGKADVSQEILAALRTREDLTAPDLVDAAEVATALGRYDEALADLDRAASKDADLPGLSRLRVECLAKAGRHEEALALAGRAATKSPDGSLLSLVAGHAERAGDLDVAIKGLREAIQVAPHSEDRYIELSEFCVKYRNADLALEILDIGLQQLPESYRLLVQKGITLGQAQRYEPARQVLSRAIDRQADHSVALTALGVSLILAGDMRKALELLGAGADRFPNDFYMHYIYGFALDRSRAEDGDSALGALAERHLRKSIELNGEFPSAYFRLGKLLVDRDPEAAIHNLEAAVRLDPESMAAKYQLGQLYLDMGRRDDGTQLIQQVGEAKQLELDQEQMPQFRAVKTLSSAR